MTDLLGMIHLPSLKAGSEHPLEEIIEFAIGQAQVLQELQYDGIIIENFGDGPFAKLSVDDVVLAKLAIICHTVRKATSVQVGLNILRNATQQAMKIATVVNLDFVRSNIWEGAYVTDQGIIEGVAHEVMATKNQLRSPVKIFADVFVKHATPLADFSIVEAAEQALERGGADRIIISGRATGDQIDVTNLDALNAAGIKPMIGSGLTADALTQYRGKISGAIVGTAIKEGDVRSPISQEKAQHLQQLWKQIME